MDNWRQEYKEMNPELIEVENELMSLLAERLANELKTNYKSLFKFVLSKTVVQTESVRNYEDLNLLAISAVEKKARK